MTITGDSDGANHAYQNLHPDEILASVEALGFTTDGRLLALNSYENRVYQVGLESADPVVAKFYRPGRWSDAAVLEEHEFALELAAAEIPVVAPLVIDGNTLHHRDGFRYTVFPRRGGRWPELDDENLLSQVGRFLGRIHAVGEVRPFEHRPALDIETFGYASVDTILAAGVVPGDLETSYETLADDLLDRIEPFMDGIAQTLRLHGDLHPSNLLARDDVVHIVDLDDARMGPSVQDLWMFLSGPQEDQLRQLDRLLTGYTEFRTFDTRELVLIEPLRTLRIMHYAAWLTRRYADPAFQRAFPWFAEPRYWEGHILSLREQLAALGEEPLFWDRQP